MELEAMRSGFHNANWIPLVPTVESYWVWSIATLG